MTTSLVAAVLAAGLTAVAEHERAPRTVVADCTRPTTRSWRLGALEIAGCRMWRAAHHHPHGPRVGHRPAHSSPHHSTGIGRRAV